MVPAAVGVVGMVVYALVLPDPVLDTRPPRLDLKVVAETFWVSPFRHPDFGFAWWSRFLIILSSFLFTTFRLELPRRPGGPVRGRGGEGHRDRDPHLHGRSRPRRLGRGCRLDLTGKRKMLVASSTLLFGVGVAMLAHADSLAAFYWVEAIMGLAYGIYMSVDMALILEVLPNPDDSGKDLGVFNMANAILQSAAPFMGSCSSGSAPARVPPDPTTPSCCGQRHHRPRGRRCRPPDPESK